MPFTLKSKNMKKISKSISKKLKYKHKNKKIQKGGSGNSLQCSKNTLLNCKNPDMFFNNIKGNCWMISIFMIVLMNDDNALLELSKFSTIDCDGNELSGKELKEKEEELTSYLEDNIEKNLYELKGLPLDLKDKNLFLVANFFIELSNRLVRKKSQINSPARNKTIRRYPSMESLKHSMKSKKILLQNKLLEINSSTSCEYKINKYFKLMFNKDIKCLNNTDSRNSDCGGGFYYSTNLILVLSIFLCKKNYTYYEIYRNYIESHYFISQNIDSIIGIEIFIPGHSMSFYKCNNKLMFCSNNFIVEYDWKKLLLLLKQYNNEYELIYNRFFERLGAMGNNNKDLFYFKSKDINTSYFDINIEALKHNNFKSDFCNVEFLYSITSTEKKNETKLL
jgi:hypothetical protein